MQRDELSAWVDSEMAERIPDDGPVGDDAFDALKDKLLSIFDETTRAEFAAVWDAGWDACASWWEIHHHRVVADKKNPYRRTSSDAGTHRG